ncbi:FAD-dependent oxidoreductase [Ktedonobacter racemifer]|uniref:FAD-dependent pyridine nucleotide-disulfide oxidoreductase n=1 Tax=Ktedonobacter racemifer DSM 44963 TaxID=485913 RepID=D6TZ08_KTERA|nr:FAD-dependent oxidoreductase [Ktedonobacter racemifer]EFH81798.1 FAD-dependent pyridine nucleotide-disulfide oxidoreductase [Ktedonobacter racemifer DSM 44963]
MTIKLYGTNWCSDCKRSKKFLGEQRVRYDYIDIEEDEQAQAYVRELQKGGMSIPTIVFDDQGVLIEPSNAELAEKLGLDIKAQCTFYDLIVVGGGPTALTAAIYIARDGYDVLVIERSSLGGQAGITERLDNYPGFPHGVTGGEFAERVIEQAKRFDVEMISAQNVVRVGNDLDAHFVESEDGTRYRCNAILLATGSSYKRLDVPGESEYIGAGIHFCATCDGPFYKGQDVVVVGSGNSAVEEAVFLTRFSPQVTILARGERLSASKLAIDKALSTPEIKVRYNTEIVEFKGENNRITTLVVKDTQSGKQEELHPAAAFIFIGLQPNSEPFRATVASNAQGFIRTGADFQTNIEGIFAAGDVRAGSTKQLVSAAGEGAAAAIAIREHLSTHHAGA